MVLKKLGIYIQKNGIRSLSHMQTNQLKWIKYRNITLAKFLERKNLEENLLKTGHGNNFLSKRLKTRGIEAAIEK